jgi:hypothetical protein
MSRAERLGKLRAKLNATEAEFRELLVACLHKCKDGGRGVFLTEERAASKGDVYARLVWPEAKQLEIWARKSIRYVRNLATLAMDRYMKNIGIIAR